MVAVQQGHLDPIREGHLCLCPGELHVVVSRASVQSQAVLKLEPGNVGRSFGSGEDEERDAQTVQGRTVLSPERIPRGRLKGYGAGCGRPTSGGSSTGTSNPPT